MRMRDSPVRNWPDCCIFRTSLPGTRWDASSDSGFHWAKPTPEALEKKYKFTTRIEAEEIALETASMVVTSTNQEVQQQYELYDHYVPSRMEVIPPGVDLSLFSPRTGRLAAPQIADELACFLRDPDKPIILTMARPDERKNLEMLVQVYGESEQLQDLANLVMIMGTRDDLRELPKAQQTIINNVLYLIDRYDLYGKVAYPKTPHAARCAGAVSTGRVVERRVHQSRAYRTVRPDAAGGRCDRPADRGDERRRPARHHRELS